MRKEAYVQIDNGALANDGGNIVPWLVYSGDLRSHVQQQLNISIHG